jgi:hypothetical protein
VAALLKLVPDRAGTVTSALQPSSQARLSDAGGAANNAALGHYVQLLLSDVEARSNNMDGLFVKPAVSPDAVDALYSLICKCSEADEQKVRGVLAKSDVYDVCRTVMKYLKLSDPLLTYSEYTSFLLAQANPDAETRILGFIGAIQRLPSAQLPVTRQLFALLNSLVKREVFKASAESLAYTFGPHLLRKRQPDADIARVVKESRQGNEVVKFLIQYADILFADLTDVHIGTSCV